MQNQGTIWSAGIGPRRGCAPKIVLTGRKEEDGMSGGWEGWTHRNGTLGLNGNPTLAGNQRGQNVASGDGDDNNERGARNCLVRVEHRIAPMNSLSKPDVRVSPHPAPQ